LPEGSTLEISYASTDDAETRDRLNAVAKDDSIPASHRVQQLFSEPELWQESTVFYGNAASTDAKTFSAKLFDVKDRYLLVSISLTASAGAQLPLLSELVVLYPGRTLMEDLPSIYQKEEERPNSFLRALVGVFETTTQGLDSVIASMGRQIHPTTAPEPWLDFIARWLGVPWDDALSLEQKRAIVLHAADLANARGTRAGLEALLESLLPGTPRRFRITDRTADAGFAVVGSESCPGTTLPALLGGHTLWSRELGSDAVLGHMRLPRPGQLHDGAWHLTGKIPIDVAATAAERKALEPWLLALISEMVPLTARVELRWVSAHAMRTNRLDGTMTLQSAPAPHLGTDAITSVARLPERRARLSTTGIRLR
jgi:phage tail-like protein